MKHVNSITYYPQGNGHAKFTNKVLGTMLTKLVSESKAYWDEHLSIVLFLYKIAYKVIVGYTPHEVMYG